MQTTFSVLRKSRELYLRFLDNYTPEQLNKVPEGFNNNIYWNIAHIVVTQQRVVYSLSGLPMMISEEMAKSYMRGTKPERDATQAEINELKELLFTTVDKTEQDFNNGIFTGYKEYTTEFGYTLRSAKEGLEFNNFHEGVHMGVVMALRKLV